MLNISFLACTKVDLWDQTVCSAVNVEKFQSHAMTLTSSDNAQYRTFPRYFHILQCILISYS